MSARDARRAVEEILDRDLADLLEDPILPPARLENWRLPEPGKTALRTYGLPPARADGKRGITGAFQDSDEPETWRDAPQFYGIATFGVARLGAVVDAGHVLGIPPEFEIHPQLTYLYPNGIQVHSVNAAVEHLVDCAWRWHWILPLLAEEERTAGETEIAAWKNGTLTEDFDPYVEYEALCRHVLTRFQAADPSITDRSGLWPEEIVSDD